MSHPDEVLAYLAAGNARYAAGEAPARDWAAERQQTWKRQEPFATVLACADSRMPVEQIFDCGLGDLMVVRTAGHIADDAVLRSIAFTVEELAVGVIVVLGHTDCAAVGAARSAVGPGSAADWIGGKIRLSLVGTPLDEPYAAEKAHARETARRIRELNAVREALARGELVVAPAIYDLESGAVTFL